MADLPLMAVKRLIERADAKRVGKGAVMALRTYLEEEAVDISKQAIVFATHAKRKTVRAEDIELVIRRMKR